jgi:hypothetical protein
VKENHCRVDRSLDDDNYDKLMTMGWVGHTAGMGEVIN